MIQLDRIFHPLCPAADIPVGKSKRVVVEGVAIAIFHLEEGFFAIADTCPHQSGSLTFGWLEPEGVIACPRHGARFDVRTGEVLTLPAVCGVRSYPVRIEGETLCVCPVPVASDPPAILRLPQC